MPPRFVRIRHYGLFGNRKRAQLLPICMQLLGKPAANEAHDPCHDKLIEQLSGPDPRRCPHCNKGRLEIFERIPALWEAAAA